jgi:hypothetical protein
MVDNHKIKRVAVLMGRAAKASKARRCMSEEIKIAKPWLAKAKNDLLNADNNLKADNIPFDTVCFHCQQAKSFLKPTWSETINLIP